MTDRYSKWTRAVPASKTTLSPIASISKDKGTTLYGIPAHVLTNNETQFVSKFYQSLWDFLGTKYQMTTAYNPQTNGQAERFDKMITATLQHYQSEHQRDWNIFNIYVQPLTYLYDAECIALRLYRHFGLVLSWPPPGSTTFNSQTMLPTAATATTPPPYQRLDSIIA